MCVGQNGEFYKNGRTDRGAVWTRVRPRNRVLGGARICDGRDNFEGDIPRPITKYVEYPAYGRYSQRYSVVGSSDAAYVFSYCSRHDIDGSS